MRAILTVVVFCWVAGGVAYGQKASCETDRGVYNKIVQIEGKVTIINRDFVASGQYLVFQRDGCKECLVAVHTDGDGNYKLLVGEGRYKVIALDISCDYGGVTGCDCYEMLASNQPRYVDAQGRTTVFDINLRIQRK